MRRPFRAGEITSLTTWSALALSQDVVEGGEHFVDAGLCLVAHVTDPERGALDFSVSSVDEDIVFCPEGLDEFREVEVLGGVEAGE